MNATSAKSQLGFTHSQSAPEYLGKILLHKGCFEWRRCSNYHYILKQWVLWKKLFVTKKIPVFKKLQNSSVFMKTDNKVQNNTHTYTYNISKLTLYWLTNIHSFVFPVKYKYLFFWTNIKVWFYFRSENITFLHSWKVSIDPISTLWRQMFASDARGKGSRSSLKILKTLICLY